MAINVSKEEITKFVENHVMFWQDENDNYPSFIYKIIWRRKEYITRTREEMIMQILKEENK
jgi:hypothetical protein